MPTWTELQQRQKDSQCKGVRFAADEELVIDSRARMTPGNYVEEKLRAALAPRRRQIRRVPK
jgi:hypothetical protein